MGIGIKPRASRHGPRHTTPPDRGPPAGARGFAKFRDLLRKRTKAKRHRQSFVFSPMWWIVGLVLGVVVLSVVSSRMSESSGQSRYREAVRECGKNHQMITVLIVRRKPMIESRPICDSIRTALDNADCPHLARVFVAESPGMDTARVYSQSVLPGRYGSHQTDKLTVIPFQNLDKIAGESARAHLVAELPEECFGHGHNIIVTLREGAQLVEGWDTKLRDLFEAYIPIVVFTSPVSPGVLAYTDPGDSITPVMRAVPVLKRSEVQRVYPSVGWTADFSAMLTLMLRQVPFQLGMRPATHGLDSLYAARLRAADAIFYTPADPLVQSAEPLVPETEDWELAVTGGVNDDVAVRKELSDLPFLRQIGVDPQTMKPGALARYGAVDASDACEKHGTIPKM